MQRASPTSDAAESFFCVGRRGHLATFALFFSVVALLSKLMLVAVGVFVSVGTLRRDLDL